MHDCIEISMSIEQLHTNPLCLLLYLYVRLLVTHSEVLFYYTQSNDMKITTYFLILNMAATNSCILKCVINNNIFFAAGF